MADAASPSLAPRPARVLVIDWLRGLAVVLMILAHAYDAWLLPAAKTGPAYDVVRHLSGIPSRLFLFLVGVSAAVVLEKQIAKGVPRSEMRGRLARRGLLVIGLAYLFRVQELTLAGFHGGWPALFRVDILNCIGASLLVLAVFGVPRAGRPRTVLALAAAAVFIGLGPLVGPAYFPTWLPRPLTSYLGGQRPMSWFPLFPWAAWALVGLVVGHWWLRASRTPALQARCFVLTGALGAACTGTVALVQRLDPPVIRYPSELAAQMGPGSFFFRLGIIGVIAFVGWVVTRVLDRGFSPLRQLGMTSLLIYWVHIDLCYGPIARPLRGKLTMASTTVWFLLLTLAMLGLSVFKTRHWPALSARLLARQRPALAPQSSRSGG